MRHMQNRLWRAAMALLLVAGLQSTRLEAQVLYGSVVGSVQDQSGAVVPNVSITITNKATGLTRESKSDESGNYSINNVLPGSYTVKTNVSGFRTLTRENLEVAAGTVARADFALEVGQVTEQVTGDREAA